MGTMTVSGLTVRHQGSGIDVIDDVCLTIDGGEIVGVVGESTAGKTTLGLALAGAVRDGMTIAAGEVRWDGNLANDLARTSPSAARRVGFVPQRSSSALNPAFRIGSLLSIALDSSTGDSTGPHDARVGAVLDAVALPSSDEFLGRFAHQLSGGQRQRVMIALALLRVPDVLVLDEPTSDLDAVSATRVLDTVRGLSTDGGVAGVCISHDLAVVADVADRVVVLYAGHVVEEGPADAVLHDPAHPYTRHLVAALPDPNGRRRPSGLAGRGPTVLERGGGCRFASRCDLVSDRCRSGLVPLTDVAPGRRARCVEPFVTPHGLRPVSEHVRPVRAPERSGAGLSLHDVSVVRGRMRILDGVSLEIAASEWLAILGESGAGKSTMLRSIAGLDHDHVGSIALDGEPLAAAVGRRTQAHRDAIGLISQHPAESFNPRRPIGVSVARPLRLGGVGRTEARRRTMAALDRVGLGPDVAGCHPDELSGGELQRAAIARAVVGRPTILLCDEITSSLDGVVRATIVDLLDDLRSEMGLTIVFVAHDPALVRSVSDRTAVLADGRLVEVGPTSTVFDRPRHDVTKALLAAGRRLPGRRDGRGDPEPGSPRPPIPAARPRNPA